MLQERAHHVFTNLVTQRGLNREVRLSLPSPSPLSAAHWDGGRCVAWSTVPACRWSVVECLLACLLACLPVCLCGFLVGRLVACLRGRLLAWWLAPCGRLLGLPLLGVSRACSLARLLALFSPVPLGSACTRVAVTEVSSYATPDAVIEY